MAGTGGKLTALKIERLKTKIGMHHDGGGLYLQVTRRKPKDQTEDESGGGASWVLRYMLNGKPREMGLGPLALFGLADARAKALDARRLRHAGIDPIEHRRAERSRQRLEAAKAITFKECAESYIASHRTGWRNAKHKYQWTATLETYAEPIIGKLPVQAIDTALVLKVIEPIWTEKPETASRLRQRIENILDWAKVRGYRAGENPARWRGHLDKLLPARAKVAAVEHLAALPYAELPAFLIELRMRDATAARALEFAILTGARTGEVIGARWSEIDLLDKTWTVPAGRMKAGKEHRVPLAPRALAILEEMAKDRPAGDDGKNYLFGGAKLGKPLSNMSMLMLLRRMGRGDDLTVHGFRSTFRTWAAERTSFPREVIEAALAHTIGSKVEAAYQRGDLYAKRRRLMEAWAQFCLSKPAKKPQSNVMALRAS
jgi:integrase